MTPPDALLFVSNPCPNCPAVLAGLAEMVKAGSLGELRVINVEQRPQAAAEAGVRAVPWVRIGPFELTGLRSRPELEAWAAKAGSEEGMADWFHTQLKAGELRAVLGAVRRDPATLAAVLPIVANPAASLNVRIGASAVLDAFAGTDALRALTDRLGAMSAGDDPRVRADACHYLGLSGDPRAEAYLAARLADAEAEVREIAQESLEALRAR